MTDAELIGRFFSGWGIADTDARKAVIDECLSPDGTYADPHCPAALTGPTEVNAMLASFTANMPGATAKVVGAPSSHNGFIRVTVSFENDGAEMMRGQYFAQRDGDQFVQVIGFLGMGDT